MLPLSINNQTLAWGERTYVMGILNATPDSFSGDGLYAQNAQNALAQAHQFVEDGADILDVGGESTRPGSEPVDADEEIRRVIPIICAIAEEMPKTLISVDTYKASVAEAALAAGAHIVNDVWGLRADSELASVVAKFDCPVILMHNRSNPASVEVREKLGNAFIGAEYGNLLEEVKAELLESVEIAEQAGVKSESIILDPGIGFGKTIEENLELNNRLNEIRALGYPVLLGPSRKSFIGYTLDLPADQRVEGTAASVAIGIARGADIIRVHDVKEMTRIVRMTDAIVRR
ncbi:MAG: dihydropteroate synthase [Anaerolineae bacterium]|jgi:dihydropteroate synthase|nr:dihydropteroate synthase [Anaerolineae bacterium]MBT3713883.1 dihydropteroate synthase [Anaerolineae bacterium]MBT4310187.1 dihydropteroate synthase [Anaerolineae bacterium]MBT4457638.1 dihydropteroate synthase [Anaerolineae bacterium]MBT4841133.1 dihydropteroate synthase [Anaerolineae bacterium]